MVVSSGVKLSDFDIIETGDHHVSRDLEAVIAERADDAMASKSLGDDALGRLFVPARTLHCLGCCRRCR